METNFFLFLSICPIYFYATEISIEEFKPSEWAIYRDLRLAAVQEFPHAYGTSYREEMLVSEYDWKRRLGFNMLCAKIGNKIVGMVGAVIDPSEKKHHIGLVISLYVFPEFRGIGAGESLMAAIIERLKNLKIIKITLEVSIEQKPAIALYKKLGFHITGFLENAYQIDGRLYDHLMMTKFL